MKSVIPSTLSLIVVYRTTLIPADDVAHGFS